MNKNWVIILVVLSFLILACATTSSDNRNKQEAHQNKLISIPSSPQRDGNPINGRKYLLEGDYLDSGIPAQLMSALGIAPKMKNYLNRTGANAELPPQFTFTQAANGVDIIAPNCMVCHGAFLGDDFILGLGNYDFDGTINSDFALKSMAFLVEKEYSKDSNEWDAFEQFYKATLALSGNTKTEAIGANSADKITEVLLAHRRMPNMQWSDTALLKIHKTTVPADPPAWWLLKKKNAQFTTGIGQGDFARISTASSLLTMIDVEKVKDIDDKFTDIIAFIRSIKAPKYPEKVDFDLAADGERIFIDKCSKCHGKYGNEEYYPNYIVHLDVVKTDPMLSNSYHERIEFVDLYNESWFGQGEHAAHIVPTEGYVAPPLDGVWATAPYLHNGSIPTIDALLNSPTRPKFWKKKSSPRSYDYQKLGWEYDEKESKVDKYTYDTSIEGYGNMGHYFGDKLLESQRHAVIEYLKTL